MSERPTPETDAAWSCFKGHTELLHDVRNLSRKLERERDEALMDRASGDMATMTRNHYERLIKERDEAREIAGRLAHFLERPAYSVDEAIARMEALNSYKQLATL